MHILNGKIYSNFFCKRDMPCLDIDMKINVWRVNCCDFVRTSVTISCCSRYSMQSAEQNKFITPHKFFFQIESTVDYICSQLTTLTGRLSLDWFTANIWHTWGLFIFLSSALSVVVLHKQNIICFSIKNIVSVSASSVLLFWWPSKCISPAMPRITTQSTIFWWPKRRFRAQQRQRCTGSVPTIHRSTRKMWPPVKHWSYRCGMHNTATHHDRVFCDFKCPTFTSANWRKFAKQTRWPSTWDAWINSSTNWVSTWCHTIGHNLWPACCTRHAASAVDHSSTCARTPTKNWKTARSSSTSNWKCTRLAVARMKTSRSGWADRRLCCAHPAWSAIIRSDGVRCSALTRTIIHDCQRAQGCEGKAPANAT